MSFRIHTVVPLVVSCAALTAVACGSSDDKAEGGTGATGGGAPISGGMPGTSGGRPGTGGSGGQATGGTSGSSAGTATTAGKGGTAGSVGLGGFAGATSGSAGAGGASGSAGSGVAGVGGMAGSGSMGGVGQAGMPGTGGSAGSGMAGGGTAGSGTAGGGSGGAGAFTVTSPDFDMVAGCSGEMESVCDVFPDDIASYMSGPSISPELNWTGAPSGTMSFAVVFQDQSINFTHWAMWNIPGSATGLPANIDRTTANPAMPAGSQQAGAGSGATDNGFFGPGSSCNVYQFTVYALAVSTFSPTQATNQTQVRTQLLALGDDILGTATIAGRQEACASGTCNYSGAMPSCQ